MTDDEAVEGHFSPAALEEDRRAQRAMSCQLIKEYVALAKRRLADVEAALDRGPDSQPADRQLAAGVREALDMAMGEVDDLLQSEQPRGKPRPVTAEPLDYEDNDDFGFGGPPSPGPDGPVSSALHNVVQALNWWTLLPSPRDFEKARQAMLTCLADARDVLEEIERQARDAKPQRGIPHDITERIRTRERVERLHSIAAELRSARNHIDQADAALLGAGRGATDDASLRAFIEAMASVIGTAGAEVALMLEREPRTLVARYRQRD